MRVLALTHVFPRSPEDAAAPFLLTWARGLRSAGAAVVVIAPHDAGLPLRATVSGVGVRRARYAPDAAEVLAHRGEMHVLARRPWGPPLVGSLVAALAAAVRAQVRAGRPDVLHVHWWLPSLVAARLAGAGRARGGVPVVLTVHGTDVALLESHPRLSPAARWALAAADRVEAVSSDLAERLERATGRAADAVAPMPLALRVPPSRAPEPGPGPAAGAADPSHDAVDASGPFTVLAVGRLVPEKGFADLVEAVGLLVVPARLVVVGDGPERAALAARARVRGVALELTGALAPAELAHRYATASVVAVPSHREGFGLVAAEAAVAGVPVVATDSGGARDVLGSEGLVRVGDVAGLAVALGAVAADPEAARRRSAQRSESLAALLSPEAAAARSLVAYAAVTARR